MPSSVEVLASPAPPAHRPVLRAVLAVVGLGLVAWAAVARLLAGDAGTPAAAPTTPAPVASPGAAPTVPPPWVRFPTPLEGRWVSDQAGARVVLVIHNAYLDLWQGVGQQQGQPLTRRVMVVAADRVHVRRPGERSEVATYRWRISDDRLSFELLDQTPKAFSVLAGLSFERS